MDYETLFIIGVVALIVALIVDEIDRDEKDLKKRERD